MQINSIRISVIVCTYNRRDMLERALIAYGNQTFRDFEVIVTSDGSSDGTDEMMRMFQGRTMYQLHYIRQADQGFRKTLALNKAIRLAKGDILVFADDDMIPPPRYLEGYEKVFHSSSSPDNLLVYSKYLPVDSADSLFSKDNIRSGAYMRKVSLYDRIYLFYWKLKYLLYFWLHNPKRPKLNGNNFAVSSAAIYSVNGMDMDFTGWGYEDDDLRARLLKNGILQYEAVCSAWNFNLGYDVSSKTTTGRPELRSRSGYNKSLAYDADRPARCVRGIHETEAAEIVF